MVSQVKDWLVAAYKTKLLMHLKKVLGFKFMVVYENDDNGLIEGIFITKDKATYNKMTKDVSDSQEIK